MGLYKIDNVTSEEWEHRMRRRHDTIRWMITLAEIALIAGMIVMLVWMWNLLEI